MSSFKKELRVIPWGFWITGAVLWLGFATALFFFAVPNDHDIGQWPRWGQALFCYGMMSVIIAFVALIGYVYGDAKRRGMRYVMWTLLAIFVPYLIGVIVYFLLRDPLPKPCPGCGNLVKPGFTFCPNCGTTVQPTCPNCGKAVELGWSNCPQCGQGLPSKSPRAA